MSRCKDKKSGYSTFNEMVNGVNNHDRLNLPDIKQLEKALEEWGNVKWTKGTGIDGLNFGRVMSPHFTPDRYIKL